MKKALRKKKFEILLINVIAILAMAFLLSALYINKITDSNEAKVSESLNEIEAQIDSATQSEEDSISRYDALYTSKAATVAYMINYTDNFEYTESYLENLADTLNVSNIIIVDSEGNINVAASEPLADFTKSRFNQLREVFKAGASSGAEPFTVQYEDEGLKRRYYAARVDDLTEVIIEHDPAELDEQIDAISSYQSIFDNITVGNDGFAFGVSTLDYTFLSYAKDPQFVGRDALASGMNVETLTDGYVGFCNINGDLYYAGVRLDNDLDILIVAAIPAWEIIGSAMISATFILFIFILIVGLISYYGYRIYRDSLYGVRNENDKTPISGHVLSSSDSGRLNFLMLAGFIIIVLVSIYIQVIAEISDTAISSIQTASEIHEELRNNESTATNVEEQYNRRYLNKALIASEILSENHDLQNREDLTRLNEALDTEAIYIFDNEGVLTVSTSSIVHLTLSEDPEDQTYEFRRLLVGLEYLIQEPRVNDVGLYSQFIGYTLKDEEGIADGFVQIELDAEELTSAIDQANMDSILSRASAGFNGMLFALEKDTGEITYHNNSEYIGRNIEDLGLSLDTLYDGLNDYLSIGGETYIADCTELDGSFVVVALPDSGTINGDLLLVTLGASLLTLLSLFLVTVTLKSDKALINPVKVNTSKDKKGKTEKASDSSEKEAMENTAFAPENKLATFFNRLLPHADKDFLTAEQSTISLIRLIFMVLVFVVLILMIFRHNFFDSDSVIIYILDQRWQKGINIFSVTACIIYVAIGGVCVIISDLILSRLANTANARVATVYHLIRSLIKYAIWIIVIYYCLAMFGVDTTTLLASAGLLSVAFGLGSQSLISDIIAGLFIILEGEFQVGDIVNIGGWTGTVTELGIRTTKVESGGNVKIFTNSSISGAINMSKKNSSASITMVMDGGESIEKVEEILKEELPGLKKLIPQIIDGPSYDGVSSLSGGINIAISATCLEKDRGSVESALYRAVKLIFVKYGIKGPQTNINVNTKS